MNNDKYRNSQWINKIFNHHALCSVRSPFPSILHSIIVRCNNSFFFHSFIFLFLSSFSFSIFSFVYHVLSFLPSIQIRWFGRAPKKKKKSGTICSTVYLIVVGYMQKIINWMTIISRLFNILLLHYWSKKKKNSAKQPLMKMKGPNYRLFNHFCVKFIFQKEFMPGPRYNTNVRRMKKYNCMTMG